jgi:hypothetical protein
MTTNITHLTKPAAWQRPDSHQALLRRKKMKKLMTFLTVSFVFNISAFAQMVNGQGGGMMGGGWGSGMGFGFGGIYPVIIAGLVILGIVYIMKRK